MVDQDVTTAARFPIHAACDSGTRGAVVDRLRVVHRLRLSRARQIEEFLRPSLWRDETEPMNIEPSPVQNREAKSVHCHERVCGFFPPNLAALQIEYPSTSSHALRQPRM
jgi:hypothetical protein